MSTVTYHGEWPDQVDADGKLYIEQHGYVFHPGESVSVKEKDLVEKFARNRFFKTAESPKEEVAKGEDEAEKANFQTLKDWLDDHQVPYHHKLGADKLQALKDDYLKRQAAAQKGE